ncbi:response regulator [Halostella sp. JP-L12]|uniref:bacterio-opsin activator domain-containing protein n=1 Tax=Halostella TaxID=1843185 RepID=UPI000EF8317D|nr:MULTISPECIES: bacterio-opsin activator domain-containing protein [Halostella]NHN46903.1 response regulator [Halostella sp. JP-L12]
MTSDIRVLCVDDNERITSLVADHFEHTQPDIEVVAEAAPADALDRLDAGERVDCVVSDYRMPAMDGLEFLDAVRERRADVPFVLFTGEGSESVAAAAIRAGATDYIRKSTGTGQYELLANRIRNAVDGRRRQRSYEVLFDAVDDPVFVVDDEGDVVDANPAACTLWGCSAESDDDLTLDALAATVPDDGGTPVAEWLRSRETLPDDVVDWRCERADGDPVWIEVNLRRIHLGGRPRVYVTARDVTGRRRRERARDALLSTTRELMTMTAKESVLSTAVETASDLLGATVNRAYLLEETGGASRPAAATDDARAALSDAALTVDVAVEDLIFPRSSDRRYDLSEGDDAPEGLSADLRVPLGEHGVLYAGATDGEGFDRYDRDLAQILAAHVGGALDRADRDRLLRDRERQLADQRDELEALNNMNEVIRDVNQALVHVSTREEIERLVCEQFGAADQYQFAWLGRYDLEDGTVAPRFRAGVGDGYVTDSPIAVAEDPVLVETVEERDVTVVPDVARSDLPAERIDMARARGYRSVAAVPVTYQNILYDVLVVYAGSREAFGPRERDMLAELGETIGYAINTAQRRSARIDMGAVELTFTLRDSSSLLVALSEAVGCGVELVGRSLRSDGRLHLFVRADDAEEGAVAAWAAGVSTVDRVRDLGDGDDRVYEVAIRESPLVEYVADHGATLSTARAEDGRGRVVVEVRESADVRRLVERFESGFDGAQLVSRSDVTDRGDGDGDPWSALTARLTDRQREVLQVAYHSGFFEWPRSQNGEEVADVLGITQPTFHQHLRVGQRELLAGVFERRRP